jgi:purine-binding chemotaxis protein CheW
MDSKPYLIFDLGNSQYGIDAQLVKEVFSLPEIEPMPEAPSDIIGILNLRGEVVPVMHLALRLGHPTVTCRVSDQIVVLDWQGLQIGMVVDRVQELQTIDSKAIQPQLNYGRANTNPAFMAGIAQLESEQLVTLLAPEALIREPNEVAMTIWEGAVPQNGAAKRPEQTATIDSGGDYQSWLDDLEPKSQSQTAFKLPEGLFEIADENTVEVEPQAEAARPVFGSFYERYCPRATPEERAIFRQRADSLQQPLTGLSDSTGLYPLAVIDLGGEYFGIDLKTVQEFTRIRNLTAIPCCPKHIVGNMNLRGEIVTLVDIRNLLNLPITEAQIGSQTVVVRVNDIVAGVLVDDVSDVIYVKTDEIKTVPIALHGGSSAYLKGTLPLFDLSMGILDLPKIMTQGELVVNDE